MLGTLLRTQRTYFETLARAWLEQGASAVEIWDTSRLISSWGEHHPDAFALRAPLNSPEDTIGELRIYGEFSHSLGSRLQADARFIDQMLRLEGELKSMTADLVASQDQLVAMYQLSESFRSLVTAEATLQRVVSEAVRISRAQVGIAVLLPPNGSPLVVQHPRESVDEALIWQTFWHAHANERDVMLTAELTPDALPSGVRNLFFTPLLIRGALNAGIGLINKRGGNFTAPDIKLAHAIAQQASAHIDNVLLYQETVAQTKLQMEVELAQRVQTQLLPQRLPSVAGLDIFAATRPASQVGGDFYDFIIGKERPFLFVVGDVAGKGLSAALLMTMARTAIHSKARFMPNPSPEVVMRNSNEDLYDDFTQLGRFATAFIGQYLPEQKVLLCANAGHSPVVYRPANGTARLLQADSTPIGVLSTCLCKDLALPFGAGDLLIVATDGFTDVRNATDEMLGYDRLIALIESLEDGSARSIADTLFTHVKHYGNDRPQDDDQTLVVIKGV